VLLLRASAVVFFIQDAMKFPDVIHAGKPEISIAAFM